MVVGSLRPLGPLGAIILLITSGCAPRLFMQRSFKDDAGHDLYLFDGGWYLATTGERADQFYRRSIPAFGPFTDDGASVVFASNWPERLTHAITCDSLCTKGTCVRFVDRHGHAVRADRLALSSEPSRTWEWSDAYSLFHTATATNSVIVRDPEGLINLPTLQVMDTSCHSLRVELDVAFHELRDRCVLRDLRLSRRGEALVLDASAQPQPYCDPRFGTFRPVEVMRDERRTLEERGWRLAHCGHPDRPCRRNQARLRLGPVLLPTR